MAFVIYGPESEAFNTYSAVSPAPGSGAGIFAQRGRFRIGTQLVMPDGRKYRFALNGGSTLVIGDVISSAAIVATDQSMTAVAAAVGETAISFVHGAATANINVFAEGYATVSLAPGAGQIYPIASHAALTNGGTDTVHLQAGHAVRVALTATSDISLLKHPYAQVIQLAATISGAPVGVAVSAPTSGLFCWLQTRGIASVLTEGTLVIGANAVGDTATAGAAGPATAATEAVVGRVHMVEATTEWSGINLTLDG